MTEGKREFRYDAFISYKHAFFADFVSRFEQALKSYAKPLFARPRQIFRDENHVKAGAPLGPSIHAALDQSQYLILMASPEAANSPWVRDELEYWCGTLGRQGNLIIVVLGGDLEIIGTSAIDWEKSTALPPLLAKYVADIPRYIDFRWVEDAASYDLANSRFKLGVNRIVARMLDVDPNELVGAEVVQHKKNLRTRRMMVGAVAVFGLGIVVASALALSSQRKTVKALGEAAIASQAAESRRIEASIALAAKLTAQGEPATAIAQVDRERSVPATFLANLRFTNYDLGSSPKGGDASVDSKDDTDVIWMSRTPNHVVAVGKYSTLRFLSPKDLTIIASCPEETRLSSIIASETSDALLVLSGSGVGMATLEGSACNYQQAPFNSVHDVTSAALTDSTMLAGTEAGEVVGVLNHEKVNYRDPSGKAILAIFAGHDQNQALVYSADGAFRLVSAGVAGPAWKVTNSRTGFVPVDSPALVALARSLSAAGRVQLLRGTELESQPSIILAVTVDGDGKARLGRVPLEGDVLAARLSIDPIDHCQRLEWLDGETLSRVLVNKKCNSDLYREKLRLPDTFDDGIGPENITASAFCDEDSAFVIGTQSGGVAWMRKGSESIELEHFERPFIDTISDLSCRTDRVFAASRSSGIRAFRQRVNLVTVSAKANPKAPKYELPKQLALSDERGQLSLLVGKDGELQLRTTATKNLLWSRRVTVTIPYDTAFAVDSIVGVSTDQSRGRLWVLTATGRLFLLDRYTGFTMASIGTPFSSTQPATNAELLGLAIAAESGNLQIDYMDARGSIWKTSVRLE